MDYDELTQRIAEAFPGLSAQLQRAAQYVLQRPDDVALISMRGLAAGAGVHPSTMVRLARHFGFHGYKDFREPFQRRLRATPVSYLERARDLQARGSPGETPWLLSELLAADEVNVREAFLANDAETYGACAKSLADARRVFTLGLRSCFPVAFFFHYAYRMFGAGAVLMGGRGGTFADDLRDFGPGDALFAVSISPYTAETVRAVEFAKARGGAVIAVTDSLVSPLAKHADHYLLVQQQSPSFFGSITAAVAVTEALIALLVARGGEPALRAIEESEHQLEQFEAYWRQIQPRASRSAAGKRSK